MNTLNDFFQISDADTRNAVWARTIEKGVDLTKGIAPSTAFYIKKGSVWYDVLSTGFAGIYLFSEKVRMIISNYKITGCSFIPVIIDTGNGEKRFDYYFLTVIGKCGEIDNSLSQKTEVTYKSGKTGYQYKGVIFDLATWDGSDFFSPSNRISTIITERTKMILDQNGISNIEYMPIGEIMRDVL